MNTSSIPLTDRYAPDVLFLAVIGVLIVLVLLVKIVRLVEHAYSSIFNRDNREDK